MYTNHDTAKEWFAATDIGIVENSTGVWSQKLLTDDQQAEFGPGIVDMQDSTLTSARTRVNGDV